MAELDVQERQAGDVTILDMSGKITIGEGSIALRSAISSSGHRIGLRCSGPAACKWDG